MNLDRTKFYPAAAPEFATDFGSLGDTTKPPDELVAILQRLVRHLQNGWLWPRCVCFATSVADEPR